MDRRLLVVLLSCALAWGCDDPENTGTSGLLALPPFDATGSWSGTWVSQSGETGTVELQVTQTEDPTSGLTTVRGTNTMSGACFGDRAGASATVDGEFDSDVGPAALDGVLLFIPSPPPPPRFQNSTDVYTTLTVLGDRMAGSYEVIRNPDASCSGDTGFIELTRP
jgi:hypothetical protein